MTDAIKNSIVDEKITSLKSECDRLYDQITELRTTVQEIYGEMAESDRFFATELLRISERLEFMAKDIYGITKKAGSTSPEVVVAVSPTTNINPTMTNSQIVKEDKKNLKDDEEVKLIDKKSISVVIAVVLGFFAAIGTLLMFVWRILSLLSLL